MSKDTKKVGRPSKFDDIDLELVTNYCMMGATDVELAEMIGVSEDTIYEWSKVHPEFSEAKKAGKDIADAKVVKSLYNKAVDGDTTAQIFWLKNRRRKQWRDKHELEHSGTLTLEDAIVGANGIKE